MGRYDRKRVLITGGTSGIGLAAAQLLLEEGARVLVTGHSAAGLDSAREKLGADALVVHSDTASLTDLEALVARVQADLGGLDALLICAGQTQYVPLANVTEDIYDRLFAVNTKGAYFAAQKLAPLISQGGAVVFTTSVTNVRGLATFSVYAATKAALRSLTRSFAQELVGQGIRVNAVSPGPIDSGLLEKSLPAEALEPTKRQMADRNPMKRLGRPEEVAKALAFLAFEATYTTGAELTVDGGASQL